MRESGSEFRVYLSQDRTGKPAGDSPISHSQGAAGVRVGVRAAWSVMYVRSRSNPSCCRRCFCFDTRRRATHVMERRRATASGDVLRTSGEPQSSTARIMVHSYRSCYSSYRHFGTARRCGAVRCGRAIKTIVASGSRPSPETPLNQRAVERTLCSDQSAHAGGWITRGEVLICTTDE